jgi:hypothetical protein
MTVTLGGLIADLVDAVGEDGWSEIFMNEALDELEAHLAKQIKLAEGIIRSRAARGQGPSHYEDDEYRFDRWLSALREFRAIVPPPVQSGACDTPAGEEA